MNITILILTIISLGQIVDIFIDDNRIIVDIIIAIDITISVIYIKYLN